MVTAQSAWSCISTVRRLGLLPARSTPTSRITWTTSGHTCRPGWEPADSARQSAVQSRSKNAWAICERPALWVHTNSTYFIWGPPSLCGGDQLLGVLAGQACRLYLSGHCLG